MMQRVIYKFMPIWGGMSLGTARSHSEVIKMGEQFRRNGIQFILEEDVETV
jgi:hypothetical protein